MRRSFEIISLYLAPAHALNMVLAPIMFDSKQQQQQLEKLSDPQTSSATSISMDLGGARAAAKRAIIPDQPAMLRVRATSSQPPGIGENEDSIPLHTFVRKHCQSLFEKWEPTWWLSRCVSSIMLSNAKLCSDPTPYSSSGHLQTIWSSTGNFSDVDPIEYDRCVTSSAFIHKTSLNF